MQSDALFPLTLTLSLREREHLSAIWGYSLNSDLSAALRTIALSRGERVGVRGNSAFD
jgi:hypothetical protein